MSDWHLSDEEWEGLKGILADPAPSARRAGRPPLEDARRIAEVCLSRHYHSLAPRRHCFGWNELPGGLGLSPATANRHFNAWLASGAWLRFWDALLDFRFGRGRADAWAAPSNAEQRRSLLDSPVQAVVADLERAFCFFNARFFGDALPRNLVVTLEARRRGKAGHFCAGRWRPMKGQVSHHLMISTLALGRGKELALEVLLHEMVHYRNHHIGVIDCTPAQYHNRHFRDAALLAGLYCVGRHPVRGYGTTQLGARGRQAVAHFRPLDERVFDLLGS